MHNMCRMYLLQTNIYYLYFNVDLLASRMNRYDTQAYYLFVFTSFNFLLLKHAPDSTLIIILLTLVSNTIRLTKLKLW